MKNVIFFLNILIFFNAVIVIKTFLSYNWSQADVLSPHYNASPKRQMCIFFGLSERNPIIVNETTKSTVSVKKAKTITFFPSTTITDLLGRAWHSLESRDLGGVVSVANLLSSIILKAVSNRFHPQQQVAHSPRTPRYDWSEHSDQAMGHRPGRTEATLLTDVHRTG